MVHSCENTQTHKDESRCLPRVALGKKGEDIKKPDQQAACGGEKGFASIWQPTKEEGIHWSPARAIAPCRLHLSFPVSRNLSGMGCRVGQLREFQGFDMRLGIASGPASGILPRKWLYPSHCANRHRGDLSHLTRGRKFLQTRFDLSFYTADYVDSHGLSLMMDVRQDCEAVDIYADCSGYRGGSECLEPADQYRASSSTRLA